MEENDIMQYITQTIDATENKPQDNPDCHIILGIDLGTTNSCVAIWRNNNVEIIPDEHGYKTIPSYVSFSSISKYIGSEAKNQKDINVENVFYEVKRLIGRDFREKCVADLEKLLSYKIIETDKHRIGLQSNIKNNKIFTPEEISALILAKLKTMAHAYLKREINEAVITIPAHFSDAQRQATKDAATIAGLKCLRLIHEPTAAALAYGVTDRSRNKDELTVLVYDFGGGTLDCSLLTVTDGIFDVLGSSGISYFGGIDFDNRLIVFCITFFEKQYPETKETIKTELSRLSLQKLRTQCENAKKILSTNMYAHIVVENFHQEKTLCVKITRSQFEHICSDLFLVCTKCIDDILHECGKTIHNIDELILVGGMTRIPYIKELLVNRFKTSKTKINCSINPDEVVAVGAAIQGYILANKTEAFSDAITLLDATPLSLGVEIMGGCMDILIRRNTHIPYEVTKMYTTDTDYTDSVTIKIFEGERSMTQHNIKVGEFILNNIPKHLKGIPEIAVTFNIDSNGIVTVTAVEKENQEKSSLIVNTNKNGLTATQIQKLIKEAKEQEILDEADRQKKIIYYNIEFMCDNILGNLANPELKMRDEDKKIITDDINEKLVWLKSVLHKERTYEEYEAVQEQLKRKYGTLILEKTTAQTKAYSVELNATNIYGDDEDTTFEIIKGATEVENADIIELKKTLQSLCENVHDILYATSMNMTEQHKNELLQQIDDTLLWLYSCEKPTKIDYMEKIDYINSLCDDIVTSYETEGVSLFNIQTNLFDKLEELCLSLSVLLKNESIVGENVQLLAENIGHALAYLYSDEEKDNCKLKEYIEQINTLSKNMTLKEIQAVTPNNNGTNILDILKMKQTEEIETIMRDQQNSK